MNQKTINDTLSLHENHQSHIGLQKSLRENTPATSIERTDIDIDTDMVQPVTIASTDHVQDTIVPEIRHNNHSVQSVDTFEIKEEKKLSIGSKIALSVIGFAIVITIAFIVLALV